MSRMKSVFTKHLDIETRCSYPHTTAAGNVYSVFLAQTQCKHLMLATLLNWKRIKKREPDGQTDRQMMVSRFTFSFWLVNMCLANDSTSQNKMMSGRTSSSLHDSGCRFLAYSEVYSQPDLLCAGCSLFFFSYVWLNSFKMLQIVSKSTSSFVLTQWLNEMWILCTDSQCNYNHAQSYLYASCLTTCLHNLVHIIIY